MEGWQRSIGAGGGSSSGSSSLQQPLDLSVPFRPAALLNALEQQACREAGVALGQLQLTSCWPGASSMPGGRPGGFAVQVTGLLLQGALFDGYVLQPVQEVSRTITLKRVAERTGVPCNAGFSALLQTAPTSSTKHHSLAS
jgi:hypothetical protein